MNLQREIVYGYRNEVLTTEDTRKLVHEIIRETIPASVHQHLAECDPYDPDHGHCCTGFTPRFPSASPEDLADQDGEAIAAMIEEKVRNAYEIRVGGLPPEMLDQEERRMVLVAIDRLWQEHLDAMDELREGVYLRAQGQKDPLVEYKNEAYELFVTLMDAIKQEALHNLFRSAASLEAFLAQLRHQRLPRSIFIFPNAKPSRPPGLRGETRSAPVARVENSNNAVAVLSDHGMNCVVLARYLGLRSLLVELCHVAQTPILVEIRGLCS